MTDQEKRYVQRIEDLERDFLDSRATMREYGRKWLKADACIADIQQAFTASKDLDAFGEKLSKLCETYRFG